MQHPATTFAKVARTPKKAANARHFCFTALMARSRLNSGYRFACSRLSLVLGGAGIRLTFQSGGDGHEENSFVGDSADDGFGFRFRRGHVAQSIEGSATACI
jgi:hypothetical protein